MPRSKELSSLQRRSILVVAALTIAAALLTLRVHGQTGMPALVATPAAPTSAAPVVPVVTP